MSGHKDETLSHVPLFSHIFKTTVREEYNSLIPEDIVTSSIDMIKSMVKAEIRWTEYVALDTLGFSKEAIRILVEGQANSVCENIGINNIYETQTNNPLGKMLKERLKGGMLSTRTAFFEKNPVDYSKGTIAMDY